MTENAYEVPIDVRLRDVDFMGHVNNAVYATYLEEAREAFFQHVLDESLVDLDTVLATLTIDYERPIHADEGITVAVAIPELSESSIPMHYELRADGERAATARTVQVFVDDRTGRSRPIPGDVRAAFTDVVE